MRGREEEEVVLVEEKVELEGVLEVEEVACWEPEPSTPLLLTVVVVVVVCEPVVAGWAMFNVTTVRVPSGFLYLSK